jgi:hypothetical protein
MNILLTYPRDSRVVVVAVIYCSGTWNYICPLASKYMYTIFTVLFSVFETMHF